MRVPPLTLATDNEDLLPYVLRPLEEDGEEGVDARVTSRLPARCPTFLGPRNSVAYHLAEGDGVSSVSRVNTLLLYLNIYLLFI